MSFHLKSVLLLDNIDKECGRILEEAKINTKSVSKLTKDELIKELKHHDGVIVRSATKLTADVLEHCAHLKFIGRAGTGVDNIDVKAATQHGIIVMNTPGGNTISAAEQTCALICSLSRSIPQACSSLKAGNWDRKKYMGNELYGKTLAIIGLGRIGREVSSRMKSFGMKVIGFDPIVSKEDAEKWGISYYQLEEIWPQADYITVHTPLIPQTKNLIGEKSLSMCKPSVKIVNVARGGIVDEEALLKFLDAGKCGGAGIDVFTEEPPKNIRLIQHPNVICTPHLGANTYEAQRRVAVEIAQQFIESSQKQMFTGVVNIPELAQLEKESSRQWLKLAKYLGSLGAQLTGNCDNPPKISILLRGGETKRLSGILKCAVIFGILENIPMGKDHSLNIVNASTVAAKKGLSVAIKCVDNDQHSDDIQLQISGDKKTLSLTGTVANGTVLLSKIEESTFIPELILENEMTFLKFGSFDFNKLMSSVSDICQKFSLISITASTDSKWYVVKTKKEEIINETISACLNAQSGVTLN